MTLITSLMTYHNSCEEMKHPSIVVHTLEHLQMGKHVLGIHQAKYYKYMTLKDQMMIFKKEKDQHLKS